MNSSSLAVSKSLEAVEELLLSVEVDPGGRSRRPPPPPKREEEEEEEEERGLPPSEAGLESPGVTGVERTAFRREPEPGRRPEAEAEERGEAGRVRRTFFWECGGGGGGGIGFQN